MEARTRFIGEEGVVAFARKPGPPTQLTWRGETYHIVQVLRRARRLDFRRSWWRRRHWDVYVVRVHTGQVFELHLYRGPGRRYWLLYQEWEGPSEQVMDRGPARP